ncbi:hypothetical protein [Roseibium sp. MMSF_3412]|uniref:hypothetical protein n=1 Tax=Roseibium sp. MMSF_3412 TaxID=3046712 RepID=UPI00273E5088|nr:hypothetical protein [Roseibium sp. MMSF_3412]
MVLTDDIIDQYIEMLNSYGNAFSVNFKKYDAIKDDDSKRNIGGEIDKSLAEVLKAVNGFASTLRCLQTEKLPFFGRSALKRKREQLLVHSHRNLTLMTSGIATVPKVFLDGANLQITRDVLREKSMG